MRVSRLYQQWLRQEIDNPGTPTPELEEERPYWQYFMLLENLAVELFDPALIPGTTSMGEPPSGPGPTRRGCLSASFR
jgi:hypothetical protein